MNVPGAFLTFLASVLVCALSRPNAALAIIGGVCYLTQGQQVTAFGFHMTAIRIVLLAGFCRGMIRGDLKKLELNKIDWAVTLYPIVMTIVSTLRLGTSEIFVYQLGLSYDVILSYFAFRCLVSSEEDMEVFLHGLGFLILPMALCMLFESVTAHNLFAWMGGIEVQHIREGRLRCQGAFRSGITAGVFGATLMPVFVMMYKTGSKKLSATVGLLSALVIVYTSNSSGPLMGLFGGFVALLFWPWRRNMRAIRWGIAVALLCLHLLMKAPVWFLIARISDITGGDGWYRSELIDQFFKHFSDWWLLGTSNTGDWMPTGLWDPKTGVITADLTNQYVSAGVNGGLWSLFIYVLIIVRCFKQLGNAAKAVRPIFRNEELILWGLGSTLFAHAFAIISVTYWDQMYVPWWGLLAIISGVTANIIKAEAADDAEIEGGEPMPAMARAVPSWVE